MKMKRTVRDASTQLKKDVTLICEGEDTELDKHMADKLGQFVTHMMRNSVDHGVESSEVRIANGKSPRGTIVMRAYLHGGFFYLSIADDGGGINRAKVREKAVRQGLISESQTLTDDEILHLIFKPGFSTKEQATELSGRGFGMDIALTEITRLHGSLQVRSEEGKSTEFIIRLPLTLAIFNGVAIRAGEDTFLLPSSEVIDFAQLSGVEIISLDAKRTLVNIKDKVLPLIPLSETLRMNRNAAIENKKAVSASKSLNNAGVAILVKKDGTDFALKVDELIGIQRVVLKNLGKELKGCPAITGGAILSDGKVALILESQKVLEIWESSVKR
jgi:two-component system chemotaxis sensor kinase CheA